MKSLHRIVTLFLASLLFLSLSQQVLAESSQAPGAAEQAVPFQGVPAQGFRTGITPQGSSRDILWGIISNCLDSKAAGYCANCLSPRLGTSCAAELICKQTTEVWAETEQFVAIRDRKMCGCPTGFVHGLAVPKSRVTGVEDARRPEAIWKFAWKEARKKIPDEMSAALVVNPAGERGQDQLHVHLLRLRKGARELMESGLTTRVSNLDHVWQAAGEIAAAAGVADYGILVAKERRGFLVLVDEESPEKEYAQEHCTEDGELPRHEN